MRRPSPQAREQELYERERERGNLVGVLGRSESLHVHGSSPTLAGEAQLCDPLVGPTCDDGLTGRVSGGMVVEAALRAALCVTACPHACVHGINGPLPLGTSERKAGQKLPQGFVVDTSAIQRCVEAAPAATVRRLEAQVGRRRSGAVRTEDGVGKLEESVCPAVEAFVERAAEGLESIWRFHGVTIMHPPRAFRILCRQRS